MVQPAVDGLQVGDIGGHRLRGGGWFRPGLVFRISGGLIGPPEIAHLDTLGLAVLVDLRAPDENRTTLIEWADSRGVIYHHEPIALANPADLAAALLGPERTADDGRRYLGKMYRRMLDEFSAVFVRAVTDIAEAQPAAFGCAAGKDRTGLLAALIQELLGVERPAILAGYVSNAPHPDRLLEAVGEWWEWEQGDLAGPGVGAMLSAVEEVMSGALDYLDEQHGGALKYFEASGLPAETIDLLRSRLVGDTPD
ncbi:MAG TPA: tyrosine-protein phosphatase [Acidimicrobiia bacterium]|nr:tyrosine-protein phosphatase [Acidimicrobiia bacterium]